MINGIAHYVLLFTSGQWLRVVPTSWDVFPNGVSTAVHYLSLTLAVDQSWTRYNSLQQLAYFITVFIAAPTSIVTGLMQSPAISNRLGWFGRLLNQQKARSLHFIALWWFLLFSMAHVTLVLITDARVNLNMMWAGVHDNSWSGVAIFAPAEASYAVLYSLADGADGDRCHDTHSLANRRRALTILAYEMNGAPVSVLHGPPLRLRCENEVGFKMVK